MHRQDFSCAACGGTRARRSTPNRAGGIVRCSGCGLRRTWPAPDPQLLEKLYDDLDYYGARWMSAERSDEWADRAQEVLALLGSPQASVLDFGAGDGGLVAALRAQGIHAEGVEASSAGRHLARERGVVLRPELTTDTEECFTAVTLLHVLEHVADPVGTLTALRRVLTPGGRLLVEVPNVASLDALWPPLRARILDLPLHLHHFTPETLTAVVSRAGFSNLVVRRFNPLALEWALARRHVRAMGSPAGDDSRSETHPGPARPGASAVWRRALPRLRTVLPGAKLQLIATA